MSIPNQKKILLPIFFLSGFSALVYEVIWARMLAIAFGSTLEAVSAVVTAFMFGLAAGSYFMGKRADGRKDTLFTYSLTELAIGLTSLSLYFIIISLPHIYYTLNLNIENAPFLFYYDGRPVRYGLQFLLVATPTFFIGATFPLMVKSYISSRNYIGEGMSIIYAVNTLGAVFGAFLTGFFLLPWFGTRTTILIAVSINLLLSAAAYTIRSLPSLQPAMPPSTFYLEQKEPLKHYAPPLTAFLVITVLTISGFASLAYQIAWTRVLTMVIGNSVYAFSTILTAFLTGLVIGSLAFVRQIDRVKDKILLLAVLQISLWLSIIIFLPRVDSLPSLFLSLFRHLPTNFGGIIMIEFIVTFAVVLIPTILMGASFPVAARIYMKTADGIGDGLGRLYAFNTVGAIFGSFLTGFVFIPAIGVQKTIFFLSALNLFSGLILIASAETLKKAWRLSVPAFSVILFCYYGATTPDWNNNLLNRGVYLYADFLKRLPEMGADLSRFSNEFELLYYEEGKGGTVAVSRTKNGLSLQINGKTDAGTTDADIVTQTMLANLPLLAHTDPKDIAIIGLGSGITLGSAEQFPVEKIDYFEILPQVIKANRYFSSFNHNALDDPRANLIIADGRHYLSSTKNKYDVIISEPSNPWITGVSNLFTLEFFKIAKDRLREGGVLCQWFHLYSIDTNEVKILFNTFRTVFPHASIWAFTPEDIMILGSDKEIILDKDRLAWAFSNPEVRGELLRAGIEEPKEIAAAYLMGDTELKRFSKGAALNTDDRPIIEFEAPKALYRSTTDKNMAAILSSADGNTR